MAHSNVAQRGQEQNKNMAAEHTHGAAGALCLLSNLAKTIKKACPSLSWIPNAVFIICLLLLTIRQSVPIENDAYSQSYGSQRLLYSAFLNNGRASVPSMKHGNINSASETVRLLHLAFMVLLAGDVEINPGLHPLDINFQANCNLAPQLPQLAHFHWLRQPRWCRHGQ